MDQAAATVIERARKSGKCPPSLLADMTSRVVAEADGFEANVVHVMDANSTSFGLVCFDFRVFLAATIDCAFSIVCLFAHTIISSLSLFFFLPLK